MYNYDQPIITVNELVQCPNCEMNIARVIKPLFRGDIMRPDCFQWLGEPFGYGDATCCDKCGSYWGSEGKLYIKGKGWLG